MSASSSHSSRIGARRSASSCIVLSLGAAFALLFGAPSSVASAHEPAGAPPSLDAVHALMAPTLDGQININTATGDQLQLLPGVGPATAAKIIAYRVRHKFTHPTHLMRVNGIGRKTYAAVRRYIAIEGETTLQVPSASSG